MLGGDEAQRMRSITSLGRVDDRDCHLTLGVMLKFASAVIRPRRH
jgi:hypothetical protein